MFAHMLDIVKHDLIAALSKIQLEQGATEQVQDQPPMQLNYHHADSGSLLHPCSAR